MPENWSRQFPEPIVAQNGKIRITTLRQAADYMLDLHHQYTDQNYWQKAADAVMKAAKGGNIADARRAFDDALSISLLYWNDPWISRTGKLRK